MAGLEIETVNSAAPKFNRCSCGRNNLQLKQHPNADRLHVCQGQHR